MNILDAEKEILQSREATRELWDGGFIVAHQVVGNALYVGY